MPSAFAPTTRDFYGLAVPMLTNASDELWTTAEDAAPMLGLKGRNSVGKLFRDNKVEFIDGKDFAFVTIDSVRCEDESSPQVDTGKKRTLIFSLTGLELLGLLVKNQVGRRARRWVVEERARDRRDREVRDSATIVALKSQNAFLASQVARVQDQVPHLRLDWSGVGRALRCFSGMFLQARTPEEHARLVDEANQQAAARREAARRRRLALKAQGELPFGEA